MVFDSLRYPVFLILKSIPYKMNTYIEHKNLIPYLLELGWMIAKDTWTDCPQKVYDKLAKLSVDDLELVCMEYHSDS